MYEKVYQGTKLCKPAGTAPVWSKIIYSKMWDAFYGLSNYDRMYRVFLDGTTIEFGNFHIFNIYKPQARANGKLAFSDNSGNIWPAFEISGTPDINAALNSVSDGQLNYLTIVDEGNGLYCCIVAGTFYIKSLVDGSTIASFFDSSGINNLSWAGNGLAVYFNYTTGRVTFVDYLYSHAILATGRIETNCKVAAYDCTNNIIFAVDANWNPQVYTLDKIPTALSDPTFVSTPVYAVQANKVRVRLMDEDSQGCPDWVVNWELDPPSGVGSLLKSKSKTDADGYAENYFIGTEDNIPNSATITASVVLS